MNNPNEKVEAIFEAALALKTDVERAEYLARACPDPALRREVESLLAAHRHPDSVFEDETITLAVPLSEHAGMRIGRYKLLQQIGEGGMGVVYMAEQEEPVRRRVALKIIKLGMDTRQVVARFEAERQALALMDHPNIAKVLDGGATETGRPYFVMELVQGVPITEYCDRAKVSAQGRLKLFVQVCQAVQHAHQKGIIHRDIKPSNVMVTLHDGVPVPMVIDFGIAKATNQKLTEKTLFTDFGAMIGTPAYMSPEQAEMSGLDIDTRTDIYALGVLLYAMLTGTTPFTEKRLRSLGYGEMQRVILEEEPERPSTRLSTMANEQKTLVARNCGEDLASLNHLLQGDLDWIVMKCLEKDRQRRYETANGLAHDIQRHLSNEPVEARPPSTAYKLQKAIRRNKLVFMAGAAVAVALTAGIAISTWQAVAATRAKTEAVRAKALEREQRVVAQSAQKSAEQAKDAETSIRKEGEHQLYAAKMNLAQAAWDKSDMGRLRQLLEATKDSPYRGFEWNYWQGQTRLALKTLRGHFSDVSSVGFSADGQRIVTGSDDGTAKVWDVASGRQLLTLKGHGSAVSSVTLSGDGRRVITGSLDMTAKVWDASTGQELLTLKGHSNMVVSVVISADGQRIVTGSFDDTAKVWNALTGQELLTLRGHSNIVHSVAVSPDGSRIVTGSWDKTAKVWDAATGRALLTIKGHRGHVDSVAFSPDGRRLVTGGEDGTAKVWDSSSGQEKLTLIGHTDGISSVTFSLDGKRIATGSRDRTAKVWDAATGDDLLTLKGHEKWVISVAFAPDGQRIVTGSWDKTAKIWDVASKKTSEQRDGNRLTLIGHRDRVVSLSFSADDKRIASGSYDGTAKVWDTTNGRDLITLAAADNPLLSVAFSPDGRRLLVDDAFWDASSGQKIMSLGGKTDFFQAGTYSPDGQRIVTGGGKVVTVWGASNGQKLITMKGHADDILSVAISPDGKRIASGSYGGTAKVWETSTGRELFTLKGHSANVRSVTFSPDGKRIVTGSMDNTAKVWGTANGLELLTLKGHSAGLFSVAYSPDGKRIASGSEDNTAKVWEAASGLELMTVNGHGGVVETVTFSKDGQSIAIGCSDGTAKIWTAARTEQVAGWQKQESEAELELKAELEHHKKVRGLSSLKLWLVLAPISVATNQTVSQIVDFEQIAGEASLKPHAGAAASLGQNSLKWRDVALEADNAVLDSNSILGQDTEGVAYAVCYIQSTSRQSGLQVLVGRDDGSKIYLNGKPIYEASVHRPAIIWEDEDLVRDITLNAGMNVVVFKLVNERGGWHGSLRLTDAQGEPVEGIKVTLDPDAKDQP